MSAPGPQFWQIVENAQERILALDYDGTLAPFQVERMAARPLPGALEILAAILDQGSTRVAIVSGRPMKELRVLVGELSSRLTMVGSHGWEWTEPTGPRLIPLPPVSTRRRLKMAYDGALAAGHEVFANQNDLRMRVEEKVSGIAVHVRGINKDEAERWLQRIRSTWEDLANSTLEVSDFDGGIELRAIGRDKGQVVRELWNRHPGANLLVCIGDDHTDEDAFRSLPSAGIGIKVGPANVPTAAQFRIKDVLGVRDFLCDWHRLVLQESRGREQ